MYLLFVPLPFVCHINITSAKLASNGPETNVFAHLQTAIAMDNVTVPARLVLQTSEMWICRRRWEDTCVRLVR